MNYNNPIVVYESQRKDVIVDPPVYNDMYVNKDLFVLGLQIRPQRDVCEAAKNICIDSTHNQTNMLFLMLT